MLVKICNTTLHPKRVKNGLKMAKKKTKRGEVGGGPRGVW